MQINTKKFSIFLIAFVGVLVLILVVAADSQKKSEITAQKNLADSLPGLPPDPGEAGKATIEGIDSNGNGVRDDIERWIAVKYPNSEKTRAGLVQEARAFQKALTSVQDTPSASAAFDEIAMGTECLSYLVGPYQMREVDKAFLTQMLNTSGRIRANHAWQNLLPAVQSYSPPDGKAACIGFDPDTLPN